MEIHLDLFLRKCGANLAPQQDPANVLEIHITA
jgi:hypothetical protein